ncbi:hypothetical protein [Bacillus infantis]|uniref:hypothetical protein n=1 Tax=Bacillus infantis TaxID=324767 RepID=UPI003CF623B7
MKAWHVQDNEGEYQEIVFASNRRDAIYKSEAFGWTEYINVRARRAKYADGLNTEPVKLLQVQLENDWWMECHGGKCTRQLTIEDKYTITDGYIYCENCS